MLESQQTDAAVISVPSTSDVMLQVLPNKVLAKVLSPGQIDVGLNRGSVERYSYRSGEVIVCRQDTEEWVRFRQPMRIFRLVVPEACINLAIDEVGIPAAVEATSEVQDPRVESLVSALQVEHAQDYPSGSLFLESVHLALATLLLRREGQSRPRSLRSGLSRNQVRRLHDFMREHLHRNLTLGQLASVVNLGPGHFGQMFRRATEMTPHRYLQCLRLQRSRVLLAKEGSRVIDVAMSCGFKTPQHFATCFRARYGLAPTAYQLSEERHSGIRFATEQERVTM